MDIGLPPEVRLPKAPFRGAPVGLRCSLAACDEYEVSIGAALPMCSLKHNARDKQEPTEKSATNIEPETTEQNTFCSDRIPGLMMPRVAARLLL